MREDFDILRGVKMSFHISRIIPFKRECYIPRRAVGLKMASFLFLGMKYSWQLFFNPCTKHGNARFPNYIPRNILRCTHTKHPLKRIFL